MFEGVVCACWLLFRRYWLTEEEADEEDEEEDAEELAGTLSSVIILAHKPMNEIGSPAKRTMSSRYTSFWTR
jgi:hypothetical protein